MSFTNNSLQIRKDIDIWDITLFIAALTILIWALLKAIGIINTPVWIEMIPYFGGGLSIVSIAYKFGKIMNGLTILERKMTKLISMEKRLDKLEIEHNLAMCGRLKHINTQ